MTKDELRRNLEYTKKKHKDDNVDTFGTNISLMCTDVLSVLDRCVEIHEGATNGDVVKALFPSYKVNETHRGFVLVENETENVSFWNNWWYAPYKRDDNE